MAADIFIYDSDVVPVGKDQKQHIEVTRDLVVKFKYSIGPTLKLPEPSIREEAAVIPGLDGEKMSKSYGNAIGIFEDQASLRKKIMSLKTDSTPVEAPEEADRAFDDPCTLQIGRQVCRRLRPDGAPISGRRHRLRGFQEEVVRRSLGIL